MASHENVANLQVDSIEIVFLLLTSTHMRLLRYYCITVLEEAESSPHW
jgi:hypothetical protein